MKRFLTFLALCCLMAAGAWADFTPSTVENPVVYNLFAANGATIAQGFTCYGRNDLPKGEFAFIEATGENHYLIYEPVSGKYAALADGAPVNGKNGVKLVDTAAEAMPFIITETSSGSRQYNIKPSSTVNSYFNFHGGVSTYNGTQTIGFYNDGTDAGSKWYFEKAVDVKGGDYIRLYNVGQKKYLNANGATMNGNADGTGLNTLWYVKDNGSGGLMLMSVASGNYMGAIERSKAVTLTADNTATFEFEGAGDNIAFKHVGGSNYGHVNGGNLVGWDKYNNNSQWTITKEEPSEYTVSVAGLPGTITTGGVSFVDGQSAVDGGKINGIFSPDALTAVDIAGYAADITIGEGTITVSYYLAPYTKGTQVTAQSDLQEGDLVILDVKAKKVEYHVWFTGEDATLTNKDNYRAKAYSNAKFPASYVWKVVNVTDGETPTFQLQSVANANAYLPIGDAHNSGNATANLYMQELTSYSGENRVALSFTNGTNTSRSTYHFDSTQHTDAVKGIGVCFWGYNASSTDTQGAFAIYKAEETEVPDTPDPVEEANTLTPASGETVESSGLANISVNFTGENAEIIWYDETAKATLTKVGSDPVEAIEGSIAPGEFGNPYSVTFDASAITDGTWTLNIPEGTFYVVVPLGTNTPIKGITATYTVATAADPVPTAGKVYTIKAHFTNTSYKDIYLSSDTSAEQLLLPMPEAPTANQSYWVAENSGNTDRPWKFKSGYGYAKYLDWQSGTNGLSANGDNFGVLTCSTVEGTYHLNVSTSDRSIGTWGNNNDTKKGFGAVGSGGCWSQNKGHSNATASNYWTTDYIIEEVKNVDVYTVTGEGSFTVTGIDGYSYANTISAGGLVIVPSNINFTNANIQISNDYAATIDATNKTITLERITVEVLDKHLYTIKGAFNNNTYAPLICENNVIKTGANEDDPEIFVFFETTHDNVAGLAPVYKLGTVEGNGFFNWNVKGAANVTTKSEGADVAFPTSNSSVTWEGASVAEGYFGMVGIQKNSNNAYRTFVFKPSTNIDYNSTTSSVRAYNTLSGTGSWGSNYVLEEVTGYTVYDVILKNIDTTISYNGETGNCLTTTAQGNGGYLVIKDGAPLTAENITLAEEAEVVVTIDNTAHTVTVRAKGCPDEGTWYVTIENHEKGRQPFLFNDIQYADEITLQGASHDTSKNGYIWKVTSDGAGNLTVLNAENGKGIKPKSSNYSGTITNFQYEVYPADDSYFFLKFRTGSHDRLNASTSGFVNEAGQKAVTTWDGNHPDNAWKFNAVDTEDLVEYNVVVNPAESRGYAVYGGKKAGNGGFFLAPEGLTQSDFAGGELRAYFLGDVTLENHTITVNYTAATPIEVTYKLYLNDPIVDEHSQVTGYNEKHLADATAIVTEYIGKAPSAVPFDYPEYVSLTYPELVDGVFAAENTEVKVVSEYNDLMPFVPGMKTTVDIDVRNHYYFHVEKRTVTIDNEEKTLWLPCISPKSPTFEDDAAYIWVMEGDWYNGFRFHNDQIAKEAAGGDGTACHITFHHHEILSNTMEKMEGMKGETSLTEKTYTLVTNNDWNESRTRATLTDDATDTHSYFDLIYAPEEDQDPNYRKDHPDWQFRIHGTATGWKKANKRAGWYLNFRDYGGVDNYGTKDNPDSLLCIYNGGAAYADRASSFTFHKNEVCTEDDRQAVLAMIDAIEKGAVGAIIDKTAQEYQDLLTLKGRIEDTTIGCTRALFDIYTEKLVKYAGEKKTPADGEAYRLAVRTKEGRNFYLKDDGTYTTDSLDAAIYVLGSSADGTKKILAGNNNEDLYYFRNGGLTKASYAEGDCDFNYELMAGKETVADVLDATGAAKYATVCLTDGNGKVATMTSPDKATATGTCTWEEPQEVVYMNDELSSAIVMEPVVYPYTHPNFAHGTSDGRQGGFATIWLPFPMHFPDGIEVYKGTYMRDAKTGEICPYLMLTEVDKGNVTAAGGYLLYNAEQTESKMKQLVLPAPANPEDLREEEDAAFIGSTENPGQTGDATLWTEKFVNKYGDDFIPYVLADKSKDGKGIGFFRYTGATYPKGKAIYLSPKPAQGEAPAECIMFSFDDVIEAIESLHGHAITSEIYDLQGHRLNKVQKGQINVINGTKVMFK